MIRCTHHVFSTAKSSVAILRLALFAVFMCCGCVNVPNEELLIVADDTVVYQCTSRPIPLLLIAPPGLRDKQCTLEVSAGTFEVGGKVRTTTTIFGLENSAYAYWYPDGNANEIRFNASIAGLADASLRLPVRPVPIPQISGLAETVKAGEVSRVRVTVGPPWSGEVIMATSIGATLWDYTQTPPENASSVKPTLDSNGSALLGLDVPTGSMGVVLLQVRVCDRPVTTYIFTIP